MTGVLCFCGCGAPATHGKWVPGHWNRGKKHEMRAKAVRGVRRRKKLSPEEYRQRMVEAGARRRVANPKPPVELRPCQCGCGTMVRGRWVRGHVARVNNPYTDPDVKRRSILGIKRAASEGRMVAWNKGLTTESDVRVAVYGQTYSENYSEESRAQKSEMMKQLWVERKIVPLRGPEHSQWAGGVSALQALVRSHIFTQWTYPKLKRDGFRCTACGSSEHLCVHHDDERFSQILRRFVGDGVNGLGMSFEEKLEVADRVLIYHLDSDVSGVTLCETCHGRAHAGERG